MKCPHCLADLRYRERGGRICPKCQRRFAIEPRANDFKLSDLKLRGLAERLSRQGKYAYSSAQLGHFLALREMKSVYKKQYPWPHGSLLFRLSTRYPARYWLSALLFFFICVVVIFYGIFILSTSSILSILFMCVLSILIIWMLSRLFLPGKSVDISSFESKFIKPWESIHGPLPGRIDANATRQALERWTPTEPIRALVVSSIEDVHLCLFANGLPQRLGLGLVNPDHPVSPSQARWIEQAQRDPRLPIVFLHDASVAGCLLRYLVSAQWGLTPDHRIIDVGLRPNDARDRQLPWTYVKTPPALKQFFDRLASQPDTLDLERDEIEWLRADATASVLYLPPAQLLRLVTQAVAQHAPQVVDPEAEAQAQARAVGFMTWPQPVAR